MHTGYVLGWRWTQHVCWSGHSIELQLSRCIFILKSLNYQLGKRGKGNSRSLSTEWPDTLATSLEHKQSRHMGKKLEAWWPSCWSYAHGPGASLSRQLWSPLGTLTNLGCRHGDGFSCILFNQNNSSGKGLLPNKPWYLTIWNWEVAHSEMLRQGTLWKK